MKPRPVVPRGEPGPRVSAERPIVHRCVVDVGSCVVGAPRTTRPWPPDRILEEHGDALYDFALSGTGDAERAVAAVREAVPAALEAYGPGPGRPGPARRRCA